MLGWIVAQAVTTDMVNTTLTDSMTTITQNFGAAQGAATAILWRLIVITIIAIFINAMIRRSAEGLLEELIKHAVVCTIFATLTLNWGSFAGMVRGHIGGSGAASGGVSMSQGFNPSSIAESGVKKVAIIFNPEAHQAVVESFLGSKINREVRQINERAKERDAKTSNPFEKVGNNIQTSMDMMGMVLENTVLSAAAILIFLLMGLLTIIVHFYASVQATLITLEFYIIVSITVHFVPFGVNKHTSYLATGAINAVIASSVKMAVLFMIVGLMGSTVSQTLLPQDADMYALLGIFLHSLLFAFAISKVNQISGTVFNGASQGIDVGAVAASMGAATSGAITGSAATGAAMAAGNPAKTLGQMTMGEFTHGISEFMKQQEKGDK